MERCETEIFLADLRDLAAFRLGLYAWLSSQFLQPPALDRLHPLASSEFLECLEVFLDSESLNALTACYKEFSSIRERLKKEYEQLFVIPSGSFVFPYASVYLNCRYRNGLEHPGLLMSRSAIEICRFYRSAGYRINPSQSEYPDHIGVLLNFMATMVSGETDTKSADLLEHIRLELQFIEKFMAPWVPRFHANVYHRSDSRFYRAIVSVLRSFLESELATLKNWVAERGAPACL